VLFFDEAEGPNRLRKNSILLAILGGAALQRCDNCIVLNAALAAEGAALAQKRLFPQPARRLKVPYLFPLSYSRFWKILSRGQKLQNPANSIKAFQI
jgi:hypothetical protein